MRAPRFADTAVRVTALRGLVPVRGCPADRPQGYAIERFVARPPGVKRVLQEAGVAPALRR